MAAASTYMFTVDAAAGLIVDATRKGNVARFVNHCCEPNCVAKSVHVEGARRVVLFTTRDVATGEELFYDYQARSVMYTGHHTTAFAWCTPFLEDFSWRVSQPTPRFQSPPATPFNSI